VIVDGWFDETTFELMDLLHVNPTASLYLSHKASFKAHVEGPLQRLFRAMVSRLPRPMLSVLETDRNVFARIMKNDFGRGGAWDYYWGALYPRGGRRIAGAQQFVSVGHEGVRAGFYIAPGSDQRERCARNCRRHEMELASRLEPLLAEECFTLGEPTGSGVEPAWRTWLRDPRAVDFTLMTTWPPGRVLHMDEDALSADVARLHRGLFSLMLLAVEDEPLGTISAY
jgi:5-methylcytosine-specific restriction enzyme B